MVKKPKLTKHPSTQLLSRFREQTSVLKGLHLEQNALVSPLGRDNGLVAIIFEAQKTTSFSEEESHHSSCPSARPSSPALLVASSLCSLILVQYSHVFVGEEVQERNVANGLVNVAHCNFFGNPAV